MSLVGKTQPASGAAMMTPFVGAFTSKSDNANMARHGAEFGVFMALGIYATMYLMNFLYEGRSLARRRRNELAQASSKRYHCGYNARV